MKLAEDTIIDGPTSLSISWESDPILLTSVVNYSIQLFFSGSPVGSLKLQTSNDEGNITAASQAERSVGVTHWTDYFGSTQAIAAAGDHVWTVQNVGYKWVKIVWTHTSGSAQLDTARFYTRGV